jgi:sulfur relay protein TusB/DsrH
MSAKSIILIGSSPASGKATTNFNLVRRLVDAGQEVRVCLLQDGVLAGLDGGWASAAQAQAPGAKFCALDEDLALRGFGAEDLAASVEGLSYAELAEAIMGDGTHVIGVL